MMSRRTLQYAPFIAFALAVPALAAAAEPIERIRRTGDRIISIARNPALMTPDRTWERSRSFRSALNKFFDWKEISRRTLARHWVRRTAREKVMFTELLARRLERTCIRTLESYPLAEVHCLTQSLDADCGVIRGRFILKDEREIPFTYRLKRKGDEWLVYDISVEGFSLVNSYRAQFNGFIVRSSYRELVKKMRAPL
jgi:phospholipid transport system substrate-binding protein